MRTTVTPAETTTNYLVMVVVVVVVIVIIIIFVINFMQGIDNYIPQTNHVLEYIVLQMFCISNLCYM
jgi:hypothetical protein